MTNTELREKILKGTQLAIQRLIERKCKDDAYLVIPDNGKVVKVKARDIKFKANRTNL